MSIDNAVFSIQYIKCWKMCLITTEFLSFLHVITKWNNLFIYRWIWNQISIEIFFIGNLQLYLENEQSFRSTSFIQRDECWKDTLWSSNAFPICIYHFGYFQKTFFPLMNRVKIWMIRKNKNTKENANSLN